MIISTRSGVNRGGYYFNRLSTLLIHPSTIHPSTYPPIRPPTHPDVTKKKIEKVQASRNVSYETSYNHFLYLTILYLAEAVTTMRSPRNIYFVFWQPALSGNGQSSKCKFFTTSTFSIPKFKIRPRQRPDFELC